MFTDLNNDKAKISNIPIALSTIYWDHDYALNLKQSHLYSPNSLIRQLAKINVNIPHNILKVLYYTKKNEHKRKMKLMLKESDLLLPNSYSELR